MENFQKIQENEESGADVGLKEEEETNQEGYQEIIFESESSDEEEEEGEKGEEYTGIPVPSHRNTSLSQTSISTHSSENIALKRIKVRMNGQTVGGKWISIRTEDDFETLKKKIASKLNLDQVIALMDEEGTEYEDLESLRENDVVFVISQPNEQFQVSSSADKNVFKSRPKSSKLEDDDDSSLPSGYEISLPSKYSELAKTDYAGELELAKQELIRLADDPLLGESSQKNDVIVSRAMINERYVFRGIGEIHVPKERVLDYLMDLRTCKEWEKLSKAINVIEEIDEYTKIVHRMYRARVCLMKTAMDLCTIHHLDCMNDGSYVVVVKSVSHPLCPPGCVKGFERRGRLYPTGFILKEKKGNPNVTIVKYVSQIVLKGLPQAVVKILGQKQPMNISYIRKALTGKKTNRNKRAIEGRKYASFLDERNKSQEKRSTFTDISSWVIDKDEVTFEEKIGSGHYGIVFRGTWRGINVAVKQLKEEFKNAFEFEQEIIFMTKIKNHANVVSFYGLIETPLCIVTEYCSGGSLYRLIHHFPSLLNQAVKLKIIRGVCSGMIHIHAQQVCHRDLAARNVLIDENFVAKVADFGLARNMLSHQDVGTTNANTGPIRHMAPESLSDRVYSLKSDVWSFGVVLYEILEEQAPYKDMDIVQIATRVANRQKDVLLELTVGTRKKWPKASQLMSLCFEWAPESRPTFSEISAHLETWNFT